MLLLKKMKYMDKLRKKKNTNTGGKKIKGNIVSSQRRKNVGFLDLY